MEFLAHFGPLSLEAILGVLLILIGVGVVAGAMIAVVVLAMIGLAIASVVEATSIVWLIMTIVRGKPGHWFWRPFAWAAGLVGTFVLAFALNGRLFAATYSAEEHGDWSYLLIWTPVMISLPFVLLLLILAVIALVRTIIRWKNIIKAGLPVPGAKIGQPQNTELEQGSSHWKEWAMYLGKLTLGRSSILLGQAFLTFGVLSVSLALLFVVLPTAESDDGSAWLGALMLFVIGLVSAAPSLPLLWVARPGGKLRAHDLGQ